MQAGMGFALTCCALMAATVTSVVVDSQPAQAVTWSQYQQKINDNEALKKQLAGVNSQLAQQIEALDNLNSNEIPAAQQALTQSQQQLDQAKSQVQATNARLEAARKDRDALQEKIKQTGAEYDDAKDAVAQMARKSFHGSQATTVMDVVTKSTSTQEFVDKMQSDAALTRSQANAASDAASTMSTSMNRKDRLEAIEQQIATLKKQADQEEASAQKAAEDAQAKQSQLQALRDQGAKARQELESQKGSLSSQSAQEAADIVAMKSEIDAMAAAEAASKAAAYDPHAGGAQQVGTAPSNPAPVAAPAPAAPVGGGSASGMDYAVPGSCPEGSGSCYGHPTGNSVGGSAYPARNCTLWAYIRRSQLGLPVGSYMGNGADWANSGRSMGYLVNNTPHVGAVMVFARGQRVTNWYADPQYGHVAVVERVNGDGSVLVSEGGTGFPTFPYPEVIQNASSFQYVHY
ncbi:CHAP domain-containing protein [Bombiscardovia nodaiensis]|uniref:CHAP domain-containing protein n=1 Tax=Bombiscardovia nodaiensis TaxID=2932181 RepID=A0ABM8B7E4_9BIFI|nr:CHAP domain-containing protein [Bombiscardovia nodaiensis]